MRRVFAMLALAAGLALAQSDDHIYDRVRMRLAEDPAVNGGALQVEVKNGAVTLRGNVKNEKAREKAEKLAKKVKGVKSVTNELKVDPNAH
ncbi:MAG: BON domain-containing protein [Bryobacterales bacterium]|nr:BON domain-containing protein [Bryobacterales bacterium]